MPATVACVLVPNLPIQIERLRRQVELPLLISHPLDLSVLYAASADAGDAGALPGIMLYQARQMIPHALVIEPDEAAYYSAQESIAATLKEYSPAIETVGLGEWLLDVRGFVRDDEDGDMRLAQALAVSAAAASGLDVRVGLANGKYVAQQAARRAPSRTAVVVPAGAEAGFLADLPLAELPGLTGEMRRRMALLDLYTLGELAAISKAGVMRQFGGAISLSYELAHGRDPRPLLLDVSPLRLVRTRILPDATDSREAVRHFVKRLVRQVAAELEARGYDTEGLKLTLYTDNHSLEAGQAAKPPTSDAAHLIRLAESLLDRDRLAASAPVTAIALSVYPLRSWHLNAHQVELVSAGVNEKLARFETAIQLLVHRFHDKIIQIATLVGPPKPLLIQVELYPDGQLARLDYGGASRQVLRVDERWREEPGRWSTAPVRRDYFRVRLAVDDSQRVVFQDMNTGAWYLDRAQRSLL